MAAASPVPHPKDAFVVGSSADFQRDILQTFVRGWREVGDVSWYRTPRPMYVLAHPDDVRHIFDEHHEGHPRSGYVRKMLKNIMGEGLFTCDERLWRYQVQLIAPPFDHERCRGWGHLMADGAAEAVEALTASADQGPVPVMPALTRAALDVMGRVVFGTRDWGRVGEEMRDAMVVSWEWSIPRVTGFPTPIEKLTPAYRRFKEGIRTRDWIIRSWIGRRREQPEDDLISTYIAARHPETGAPLDDDRLLDAVTSAFFGVYKGVPVALAWALYLLSRNADVRTRLEQEVDATLAGGPARPEHLGQLPYTAMVIDEVLRLYPPLWLMSRPPVAAEVIRGRQIPERVYLLAVPYITHRHPEFWDDPERFDPERFTPEAVAQRHPFAYIPFGKAHRHCMGQAYSLLQLRLTLAALAQRLRFEVVPGYDPGPTRIFTLRPADGLPMTVSVREPARSYAGGVGES